MASQLVGGITQRKQRGEREMKWGLKGSSLYLSRLGFFWFLRMKGLLEGRR
jgi:hypothetical protein